MARETGIFIRHGLNIHLSRELGWASIRDKLVFGQLDAAQSIAGIALALGLGINEMRCDIAVPMILNLHGNAITLSTEIGIEKIGRGEGLKSFLSNDWDNNRPFTMAVTHRYSSHFTLLKNWLNSHGISSPEDVDIIFLPPSFMPRQLKAGNIEGYCVGEPWNSESVISRIGWCPVTSSKTAHGHPEKVLILSGNLLREEREKSINLVAALMEACELCQNPDFREVLISILAMPEYTGASPEVLRNSLGTTFNTGVDHISANGFHVFHGASMNRPSVDKASWLLSELCNTGTIPEGTCGSLSRIFREDLYHAAELCAIGN